MFNNPSHSQIVECYASQGQTDPGIGLVFQDAEGRIQGCNLAAPSLLGLTIEQIAGCTADNIPWQAIHADGSAFSSDSHPAMVALRTGQPCSNVVMGLYKPNGELVWLLLNSEPLFTRTAAAPYAVVTAFQQAPLPFAEARNLLVTEAVTEAVAANATDLQTQRTALIIDDCAEDRATYHRYLQTDSAHTYSILEAETGKQGLEQCINCRPDIILLDYLLPDLDGLEFVTQLRQTYGLLPPIIMLAGQGNAQIAVQGMKAGIVDYFIKGEVNSDILRSAVNHAIEKNQLRQQLQQAHLLRQQSLEQERLVLQIAQGISQSLNLGEILQVAVDQVRQFLQTDRVILFQVQSEGTGTVVTESVGTGWTSILTQNFYDPCFVESYIEQYRQGLVSAKTDIYQAGINPCHQELLAQLQVRANLVVPVLQEDQLWGLLIAHHCAAPRSWQPGEIKLLQQLAVHLGIAIQQSELYQRAQAELAYRKQIEAALQQNQQMMQQITDAIPGALYVFDVIEQRNVHLNSYIYHLLGYTPEEVKALGADFLQQTMHPDDFAQLPIHLAALDTLASGTSLSFEHRMRHRSGEWRWFDSRDLVFKRTSEGKLHQILGVAQDITDRKQIELELQESKRTLDALMEYIPEGITIADGPDVTIRRVSKYGEQILNRSRQELENIAVDQHVARWNIFYEDGITQPEGEALPLSRAVQQGEVITNEEWVLQNQQGQKMNILCNAGPIKNAQNEIIGGVIAWRDITERKKFLAALQQRESELQQQTEKLAQANRIKDEFLAVLSHELRTPLSAILGWSRLLQGRQFTAEKTQAALAAIERNATLQAQLIEDLLDVSRIIRGKLTLTMTPIMVYEPIQAAVETVRLTAEAKSIQLETLLEPGLPPIMGDTGRLQQIIWNLLSNAIKFTPASGRVTVRLEQINQDAQIQVIDTGKGIQPDFLPYVFELFRQQDGSTTRQFGGLGLGLAIVKQLVEAQGGSITVDSQGDDQGATFTIRFPLLSRDKLPRFQASKPAVAIDLNQVKVLVVDDEPNAQELVTTLLEQEGATVRAVSSASAARQWLMQEKFDLLISDIGMPETDGYTFLQQVRAMPSSVGQIPAIALTAYAREADRLQSLNAGYQKHLTKPIDPPLLLSLIYEIVKQG